MTKEEKTAILNLTKEILKLIAVPTAGIQSHLANEEDRQTLSNAWEDQLSGVGEAVKAINELPFS